MSTLISNHTAPVLCVSILMPIIRDFGVESRCGMGGPGGGAADTIAFMIIMIMMMMMFSHYNSEFHLHHGGAGRAGVRVCITANHWASRRSRRDLRRLQKGIDPQLTREVIAVIAGRNRDDSIVVVVRVGGALTPN